MNWNLWFRQIGAIVRLELTRYWKGRRWIGAYLVAAAPVVLLLLGSRRARGVSPDDYANLFQAFQLRFAIFISSIAIFSQSVRGETLEKTLHIYLLAPARREIIAIGKYAAGVVFSSVLFGASTSLTYLLVQSLMFEPKPPLFSHLALYLAVTFMACIIYGAACFLIGLLFKNPAPPAALLLGWEALSFVLPPLFQQFSAVYYLQSLLPVTVDRGPFAVITETPSPFLGVPVLLFATALLVLAAGRIFRLSQVTYSAD